MPVVLYRFLLLVTVTPLIYLVFSLQLTATPLKISAVSAQTTQDSHPNTSPTTKNENSSSPIPYSRLPTPYSQVRETEVSRLFQKGVRQYRQSQFREALETFEQSLAIVKAKGKRQDEATISNYIGMIHYKLGQVSKGLSFYQQALAVFREVGNSPNGGSLASRSGEGTTLLNIGKAYQSLGEYATGLSFYQQALAIFREVGNSPNGDRFASRSGESNTLASMGEMYSMLGQYAKARDFLQQALTIAREIGDRSGETYVLSAIGEVYSRLGEYPQALDFLQQALAMTQNVGDSPNDEGFTSRSAQGSIFLSMGLVYKNQGQYAEALKLYEQTLTLARELGQRRVEGAALHETGIIYDTLGQYAKALEFYQPVVAITKEVGDRAAEGLTLTSIGSALLKTGNTVEGSKLLLNAVEIWESMRPGLTDVYKVSIFETQAKTYRDLQQALVAQGKTTQALEIAERGRAKAFVELLALRLTENSTNPLTVKPLTIQDIQRLAKEKNATLVEYSIVSDQLYIWVIQPTGDVAFKQVELKSSNTSSLNTSLENLVTNSRRYIGIRGRGQGAMTQLDSARQFRTLRQLHQLLIEPIADLLPTDPDRHVIFIPQNELLLVPFPALQNAKGEYLIQRHTILTVPALQVLQLTQEKREQLGTVSFASLQGKNALVVGNPTMPNITRQTGEMEQLSPLPGAQTEAIEIAKLLQTKALTGNQATKTSIVEQMPTAKIIHLATHGLLDDFQGLGVPGAIALASSGTGKPNDGLLTADEIINLQLNAELVVLSACDTGLGRITGDGVIGLSRSLITAGVPSVIVSLWAVPDGPTEFLMTKFYQNFQQNPDKAKALRQAMLTTMKQYPNPRNWAAFTLIGEAE